MNNNEALFQLPHAPVGGRMLFSHLKYNRVLQVGMRVAIFLMEVCGVLLGTPEVSLDLCLNQSKCGRTKLGGIWKINT